MKRLIALMLVAILSASLIMSCGKKNDAAEGNNTVADTTSTSVGETGTDKIIYKADVPAVDYGGQEFKVLINDDSNSTWLDVDFYVEEITGEPINDAVYQRNAEIAEMFNLKLTPVKSGSHVADIKKAIKTNDNLYDIVFNNPFDNATLSQEGMLHNLKEIPNLDLSQPWWDQNAVNDLTIANKLYMVTGDIGTMYRKSVGIILFNKQMISDYNLESPYQLVENGKWTMDKFAEMCKGVSKDIDGNGKFDDQDLYGLLGYCDIISISMIGGGVKFATKNSDDIPEITFYSDKTVKIFEKITDVLYKPELFWSWSRVGSDNERSRVMFANGQGLFNWNEFHSIPKLREMETDFGILPMPKYDEAQDRYYHSVNPHVAMMMAIPISNNDMEKVGAAVQAMGAVSKNVLTPAYYEISLKGKYARDDESIMTMDTIFSSMIYDPGYMYNWSNVGTFMLGMVDKYNVNLTSEYEKIEPKAQTALDKMIAKYEG